MTHGKQLTLKNSLTLGGFIVLLWTMYRTTVVFPEWIDELIFKPLILIVPVIYFVRLRERRPLASIGLAHGKLFRDIYLGIGAGMLFALEGLIANSLKYDQFSFFPLAPVAGVGLWLVLIISLASSVSEEIFARGFLFTRLQAGLNSDIKAAMVSAAMYFLLLVPNIFMHSQLVGLPLLIFIITGILLSLANALILNETKTLTIPILLHAFWNMTVTLYL